MKTKFLALFVLFSAGIYAQQTPEFSFKIYFEDALGQKDTVTLGYDINATDTIDSAFGEVNSIAQPWSSDSFEVFIMNRGVTPTIKSKRQIVLTPCNQNWQDWIYRVLFLAFKNATYPIQMELSTDILQNQCLGGSFLALDGHPWYEYSPIFSSMILDEPDYLNRHDDVDGKPLSYYWITLADANQKSNILKVDELTLNDKITISPNPFLEKFTISSKVPVSNIQLRNLQGKIIETIQNGNSIQPVAITKGIYIVSYEVSGELSTHRIVKL